MNMIQKLNQILLCIIFMIIGIDGNTAIISKSNHELTQDSAILVIKKEKGIDHIKYAYQTGDRIVYKDAAGKHTVEIIGFDRDEVVAKDLKKGTIIQLDISKIESIEEYNENEIIGIWTFVGVSGIVLSFMLNYSFKKASPPGCTFLCFSAGEIFTALVVIFFLPAALLAWVISKWILNRIRPKFSNFKGFRFEIKG